MQMQIREFGFAVRVTFSSIAFNTGRSSPGEMEMTLSTFEVAVCCSSAYFRSSLV